MSSPDADDGVDSCTSADRIVLMMVVFQDSVFAWLYDFIDESVASQA